ncbi:hypothetical protein FlaCF_3762 [Flavobacterium tructae]
MLIKVQYGITKALGEYYECYFFGKNVKINPNSVKLLGFFL